MQHRDFDTGSDAFTLRFSAADLDAAPMACAHELLDHFFVTAQKDGIKSHPLIFPRARAILDARPDERP